MVRIRYRGCHRKGTTFSDYAAPDPYLSFGAGPVPPNVGPFEPPADPDMVPPVVDTLTVNDVLVTNFATHQFTVSYTDDVALDLTSFDGSELLITGPNGYAQSPTLLNIAPNADNSAVTVTYQAPGPGIGGLWNGGNQYGEYEIATVANTARDTSGNMIAAASLGTFEHLGEIVFTTTATNQIDPVIVTSDGSIVRWDLGTAANTLAAQVVDDNAPVFSYTAGTNTMTLRGRLNQITRIDFDNDGLTNITGQLQDLITIDRISINNNAVAMDVAPLLQHDSMTYLSARGGLMLLTGVINSADIPPNMTTLDVGGNNQELTGLINSTTTPASMVTLNLNGTKQAFTGQFDSANAPPNMRNFNITGNLNQLTGRWDSADAPPDMRTLSVNGSLNQFTGVFNSVDAPSNMVQLNLGGNLHTFTGLFNSADAPTSLRTIVVAGNLNAITGAITAGAYPNLQSFTTTGPSNLFSGLANLANTPVARMQTSQNALSQVEIDAAFDAFIADTSLTLTQWNISNMPFPPSGTRIIDLGARGVNVIA